MAIFTPEICKSSDGSDTLYVPEIDEHYHSVHGAVTESELVYLENGFRYVTGMDWSTGEAGEEACPGSGERFARPAVRVLEIGFGSGLNCLMTLLEAQKTGTRVSYHGVEAFPLSPELLLCLNYPALWGPEGREGFGAIHHAPWGVPVQISPLFELTKWPADFTISELKEVDPCHVVYYDAFAPDKQPAMWEESLFRKIHDRLLPGGVVVTYCARGSVRRGWGAAGFRMERLPGPPGKREMLRGIRTG
ncbi:MAG: tRNA (5-methylaminomethyl-2-thiouridine)(34)-methyltransferase MnmD [Prolixibacteraceae bacterium]|jgi:tRNA U34 5-methylaminomethyl-2-thiouridine-forming methyltransferase MnmC|nr:tRNA (5-methylaminomethyl-2-thiouridine)(34)-methyltransferase MnmD [Prolixibacteraceae bacterium]